MIRFSNGREALVFAASGALGFDGRGWPHERLLGRISRKLFDPSLFWKVTKTITWSRRAGNGWFKARPIFERGRLVGWVNALGLPGPGFAGWILAMADRGFPDGNLVVSLASIEGDSAAREKNIGIMAYFAGMFPNTAAIELNVSCPNTENGVLPSVDQVVALCRAAKQNLQLVWRNECRMIPRPSAPRPLIVKLSVAQDYRAIAAQLEAENLVEAISINSVPWNMVFPHRKSPLARYGGGGVSGKISQPHVLEMIDVLVNEASIPVIGSGVWDERDIGRLFGAGCQAISFGSVFIASPWWPTQMARKLLEEQKPA